MGQCRHAGSTLPSDVGQHPGGAAPRLGLHPSAAVDVRWPCAGWIIERRRPRRWLLLLRAWVDVESGDDADALVVGRERECGFVVWYLRGYGEVEQSQLFAEGVSAFR